MAPRQSARASAVVVLGEVAPRLGFAKRGKKPSEIELVDRGAHLGRLAAGEAMVDKPAVAIRHSEGRAEVAPTFAVRWHGTAAEKARARAMAAKAPSNRFGARRHILTVLTSVPEKSSPLKRSGAR